MDLDDSFIENLLQRNRARKEYLNEKKAGIISVSKKRAALVDEQQINSGSSDVQSEESPKRQCTETSQSVYSPHDKENVQMQDEDPNAAFVPLHSTSKTRGLAALKKNFMKSDDESEVEVKLESQVNKSSTYVFSTNSRDLCSGQKSRLANLASDIRQWEDDLHKPSLSSNNVTIKTSARNPLPPLSTPSSASKPPLPPIDTPNSNKSNTFSMKVYYSNSSGSTNSEENGVLGSDNISASVPVHGEVYFSKVTPAKNCNIEGGSGAGIHGRIQTWDQAVKATLETPTTARFPAKSPIKFSQISQQDSNIAKESNSTSSYESIDENDFAENYEIGSEHRKDKMELDFSPVKPLRNQGTIQVPTKTEIKIDIVEKPPSVQNIIPAPVQEFTNKNVDPAELPLSARKALFERALLGGTPKLNEEVIDHTLSVAQRAAMFENASKIKTEPKKFTKFWEPKRIAIPNFSKSESNDSNCQLNKSPVKSIQVTSAMSPIKMTQQNSSKSPIKMNQQNLSKSPIKTFQPVTVKSPTKIVQPISKTNLQQTTGSPSKKVVSTLATSTPSPTKNIGNHTRLIQQKLFEGSGSNLHTKEISAKVVEERKQEISSLVKNWEKLSSSSSVENNLEVENNKLDSSESDANQKASDYDEESNFDDETGNEYDEEDEQKIEEDENCSDEESEVGESVFDSQDSEIGSLMSLDSNCNEPNIWSTEDTQSISSQNARNVVSSQSHSGVSSYSDDSNYNASRSQSCTSDSSARSYDVTNCDVTQGTPSSSKEKNPDIPLLYTVSFYRKQKQETRSTPPAHSIVRRENVLSSESPDDDCTEIIQERIKALQEEILRHQTVISQTSQALNLCSATAEFSGSTEQVEGERLLLIATQKRQSCLNEISRLKTCGAQGENVIDGKGTLIISDIQLPLKREFMASVLEGRGTDTVHYFLCLIRHGAQVIVTQMMSTNDKVSDGALCFTNHIKLQNLPADFSVVFEVYALQTKKEVLPHEKKYHIKREHSKIRLTPKGKKSDGKILRPAISSPGGPSAVRSSSFGVVGFTRFTLQNCNKKTFTLDKVPFTSPLDGVLRVQLQLHAEHNIAEKGFLTMFEDVSGFGAWHRRWCALDAHHLAYWKYPDDEHKKQPAGVIDLKQCVTGEVKLVSREICARPHTFQLVTVRRQAKGDKNTLISSSCNTITTTKHLLSADTKEERINWCNKLNKALTNVRKWDPQALRPVGSMQY